MAATFNPVFWIYVLAGTVGVVLLVPTVLRALDGLDTSPVEGFVGFGATAFAITGYVLQQFDLGTMTALVAALALGAATATVHPEIVNSLGGRVQSRTEETCPGPLSSDSPSDQAI